MQMGISQDPHDTQRLKQLLARARAGEGEAFCELAQPLEQQLFQQAVALCGNAHTAEDLVSEALVEAWKGLSRYDETCRLTTWLYAILLHRYQKHIRHLRSRPVSLASLRGNEAVLRDELHHNLPAAEPSPAQSAMQAEADGEVWRLLDALAEKHRQVVLLRFFEGASLGEMAAVLGCSEGTVKSRLHHALKNLRKMKNAVNLFNVRGDT
jgi:RNA polymerase sigma-70 factor (ECF subfamily)